MHKYPFNCFDPWRGMTISFSGNVTVKCCNQLYSGVFWDQDEQLDIMKAWNDQWFQDLRELFTGKTLKGTGCVTCMNLNREDVRNPNLAPPPGLNERQLANYNRAVENFISRKFEVDHYPVDYMLDFGRACNLNCIMCVQTDVRKEDSRSALDHTRLLERIDELSLASSITLFGGEPLFIPECRAFISEMVTNPKLEDVELSMVTNAVKLDEIMDEIDDKRRVSATFSLDSWGPNYERIRRGAKWDKVAANVEAFQRRAEQKGHELWNTKVAATLMKTSLEVLPEFSQWCVDTGLGEIYIRGLYETRYTEHEDINLNPGLLDDIPDWQGKFEKSITIFRDAGKEPEAVRLENMYATYVKRYQDPTKRTSKNQALRDFLNSETVKGRSVMIWGTGSYYRHSLADWVKDNDSKVDFKGFIDNNSRLWGELCDGQEVFSPEYLRENDIDYVIIANAFRTEIREQLETMGLDNINLV